MIDHGLKLLNKNIDKDIFSFLKIWNEIIMDQQFYFLT